MFDWITNELFCPFCGFKQKGFQTNSFCNCLKDIDIFKIKGLDYGIDYEIHHICEKCKNWIEIHIDGRKKLKKKNIRETKRKMK